MQSSIRHWINLITEAKHNGVPLLYHGINYVEDAVKILRDGKIEPRTTAEIDDKKVQGISLTRSVGFASVYAPVIFGFDLDRIQRRFGGRLKPFADPTIGDAEYHADWRREAEEFLVGVALPLDGFLRAIWLSSNHSDHARGGQVRAEYTEIMRHPLYVGWMPNLWQPGEPWAADSE